MIAPAKICTVCHVEKPVDAFYPAKRYRLGVSSWCIDCDKIKSAERYAKNRDRYAATKAEWRANNSIKVKQVHASWYQRNKGKKLAQNADWSRANQEHHRELKEMWRLENPARVNAHTAKYRALKLNATPPWLSAIEMALIQEMYDVAIAKTTQTGVEHHVDHIHPLQGDGFTGLHVPWNLRVITAYENRVKLNKIPVNEAHLAWGVQQ